MSETDVPPPDYGPQTFAVWFNEQIAGLPARPSERQLLKVINGAVTYIDDLRYELPTEQTVLDVTNVVTNIKSPLDRLSARHLTQQVLNGIGDIADGAKFVLLRPREPQQEAARALQQETLTQVMEIEKRVESLLARLTQQEMVNSIKNIESLFNSQKTHEEEKQTEPWPIVASETDTFDLKRAKKWNKEIDTLLLYASLFSAVVATFAVEGVKRDAADSATEGRRDRSNNTLIFASLMVSLATASAGTLVKQWIQQYLEEDFDSIALHHVCMRQHRYNGLRKWKVPLFVGLLPVILRISFILFATGLAIRLYDFDHTAAITFAALGGIWVFLSLSAAISPLFSNNCPYRSPESLLVSNIRSFLSYLFGYLFGRFFHFLRPFIRFSQPFMQFVQRIVHYRYHWFSHSILLRFLHHTIHLFLFVLFYFPFYRFLWSLICLPLYNLLVLETPPWQPWQKQDREMLTTSSKPDERFALRQVSEEARVIRRALEEHENGNDAEANRPLFIEEALTALDRVEGVSDTTSIVPSLALARARLSALTQDLESKGFQGQLERSYGGQRHLMVKLAGRTVHAIDRALSIMQSWDGTTELGIQALVTAFLEFAPSSSNPSLVDAIGKCTHSFPATAALQFVHRSRLIRMSGTRRGPTFQADTYVASRVWRWLWRHWDETDIMVNTRSESEAFLAIACNAVSKAYIEEPTGEALKDKSDASPISAIAEPASSCIATLLLQPTLRENIPVNLRQRVAQAILKLLADYKGQEQEPGWASPDEWNGASLVAFRAAIRLCQDAPFDAGEIFEKPEGFIVSRDKIKELLLNASNGSGNSEPSQIWRSVFQTYPPFNPSIIAYVLLRIASLTDVEGDDVDAFFYEWSYRYHGHTVGQQKGPWAEKVLECIEGTRFDSLSGATYFKRMFVKNEL